MLKIYRSLIQKKIVFVFLVAIIFFYFLLTFKALNHSFWSDEAFVSAVSKNILTGNLSLSEGIKNIGYQRMQIFSSILFLKNFGISEMSVRIPSLLWGAIGIVVTFVLTRSLSNKYGGLLASFIFCIFQLNLAYATQAKPYIAIEVIFILALYLSIQVLKNFQSIPLHFFIVFLCTISTLYNPIGVMAFLPYVVVAISQKLNSFKQSSKYFVLIALVAIPLAYFLKMYQFLPMIITPRYNWTSLLRELFWRQYSLYTLPALFGIFTIKDIRIKVGIAISILSLLFMWNFVQYSHNIRYLMPIFGIVIVLFGVFWAEVGEKLFKNSATICLLVAVLIYAGGYKVVRKPSAYYSPNADFAADVQNADYKNFFKKTYELFPDFDTVPVFVGPFDTLAWYTDRNPTAMFSIDTPKPTYVEIAKSWQYGTLDDFKQELSKYPKGLVVVNDWQSFMPEDIKRYVKENLKLELRVESMEVSLTDVWPLELYSWGMVKDLRN